MNNIAQPEGLFGEGGPVSASIHERTDAALTILVDCHCCGAPLNEKIDPENICMDCVDLGCTTTDESEK